MRKAKTDGLLAAQRRLDVVTVQQLLPMLGAAVAAAAAAAVVKRAVSHADRVSYVGLSRSSDAGMMPYVSCRLTLTMLSSSAVHQQVY
jgi:hypothetical protein